MTMAVPLGFAGRCTVTQASASSNLPSPTGARLFHSPSRCSSAPQRLARNRMDAAQRECMVRCLSFESFTEATAFWPKETREINPRLKLIVCDRQLSLNGESARLHRPRSRLMKRTSPRRLLLVAALTTTLLGSAAARAQNAAAQPETRVDFGRQIRPPLSDHCFKCHGPDANAREAELRLDLREGALRSEKPVIVPGKSDQSELWRRVSSSDPDTVMPPPASGRKLSAEQKELIRRWIEGGATWEQHWAFRAPVRPDLPPVKYSDWPASAMDQFILARLEAERLAPSPAATRETLIRRLSLDLNGLPPTPEEAAALAADQAPDATERLVDRLLASPRFGERMVWEWLDAARYADTNGYQGDPTRTMWYWRDWAIAALNANQPFDQFTVEQLAGDLLPSPTQSQLIATGFHRNHMINGEGGRIAEESRVDYVQDRVETTGTVWMGLTFNCCRCHDHKFDPIAQREYYQLSAYFNSIDESGAGFNPTISLSGEGDERRLAELKQAEREANAALRQAENNSDGDEKAKAIEQA